ncbi:MAG: AbrB/MazE/SpoVT family DNA-binding domain-containing protein [Methylococcaceae bacterium]|nr:AbrB/MazE/SpoVT family DNA-binding domain-containing protein [Methylococcaceae bacterium]
MALQSAKLFINGRSQAVRLPKEFRFEGKEVYIRKSGDDVVLSAKPPSWENFFNSESCFDDDFLAQRDNEIAQERDFF